MASSELLANTEETRAAAALGGKKETKIYTRRQTDTHTHSGTPAENQAIKQINKTLRKNKKSSTKVEVRNSAEGAFQTSAGKRRRAADVATLAISGFGKHQETMSAVRS